MRYHRTIRFRLTTDDHATIKDFRKTFIDNVDSLYLLSLLLTGDQEKAERCFVTGFQESASANKAFKQWAYAWAKRAIIQKAIRALQPRPDDASSKATNHFRADRKLPNAVNPHFNAVLALEDFDRFVFVMSVLERYSDRSCALLLGCSLRDVRVACTRALERLAESSLSHSCCEIDFEAVQESD
jgi:DNA-directed RNA polymerase specialized sigma24 family protein